MTVKYRPRNDMVLIRQVDHGKTKSGIAIPQISIQGKGFFVEAVGPDVENLKVGDKVLMTGTLGGTYFEVPFDKDLMVMRQEFVILIVEEVE